MKLERSSWEEVSKIQSSYKIIKRDYVNSTNDTSLIDTKINYDGFDDTFEVNEARNIIKNETDDIQGGIKEELLKGIEEQRASIINKAVEGAEDIRLRARDTGYKEGFKKGLEDGVKRGVDQGNKKGLENGYLQGIIDAQDEANQIKANAVNMLNQAQDEVDKYIKVNQDRIIKLAGVMAESIVHSTIDTSSENIIQLIKPIIQQFRKVESIIITCNPKNYEYLKKSLYEIERKYEEVKFTIFEDESLDKNGCIIENENQIIDLQIRKQLDNIVEKILNLE